MWRTYKRPTTRVGRARGTDTKLLLHLALDLFRGIGAAFHFHFFPTVALVPDVVERVDVCAAATKPLEASEQEHKRNSPVDASRRFRERRGVLGCAEDEASGLEEEQDEDEELGNGRDGEVTPRNGRQAEGEGGAGEEHE